ncbi:hypothetical protein FQN54_003650 [Arachnomyces sp. PD_36]|nr:hypothetical protein FQN54_003650 [Arachnomyces sp. PD_36]
MPPRSLLDLPDEILEEVICYAIGKLHRSSNTLEDNRRYYPTPESHYRRRGIEREWTFYKPWIIPSTAALLLSSRRLSILTTRILFLRAVFYIRDNDSLETFLDPQWQGDKRLESVRNMDVGIYPHSKFGWASDEESVDIEYHVQRGVSLLGHLPTGLRCLSLQPQPLSERVDVVRKHSNQLVAALKRLSSLQQLTLFFGWAILDLGIFCSAAPSFVDWGIDLDIEVPSSPMFPNLRRLKLSGCLAATVRSVHLEKALSTEHLPSLERFIVQDLFFETEGIPEKERAFSPNAILAMRPLVQFGWHVRVPSSSNYFQTDRIPPPPTTAHLAALHDRHGGTLQDVQISYIWCKRPPGSLEVDITEEFIKPWIAGMPELRYASIDTPGVCFVQGQR